MLRVSVICLFFICSTAIGQSSDKYTTVYEKYNQAEDLYEKEKYSAAQEEFQLFMDELDDVNDPFYVKARYYSAISALRLYHANAEKLLLGFLADYPESVHKQSVYLELGGHYYQKKKYKATIKWLSQIDVYDLDEDQKQAYYFKLGYSYFRNEDLKAARDAFYEIINSDGQYQAPALYYYSHIAYTEKSYQTALEGFTRLKTDPNFKEEVPYYIAQIYYLQGKYDMLLEYAPTVVDSTNKKNSAGLAHLIGDAFYKVGKYDEAVPFLEEYNKKSATTRDEDYQLAFAYYKSGDCESAIPVFAKVARTDDELGQISSYHMGECYLKSEEFLFARNAFERASSLPFDSAVEEDALYNYAVLSYKLDYNPFDEAVEALNLYLTRYPKSARNQDVYQYLVNVYTTMKNYKSAMESIDRIKNLDFKMKNAYQIMAYNYGVELFENGEMVTAIDKFKLVKRYPIDPKLNAQSFYWMGEANYRKADYNAAIVQYRLFLDEPGSYGLVAHNDAYYNIAYCYFKQKDYVNAIQSFRTFTQDENETHKEKLTDAYLRIGDCYFVNKPGKADVSDDDNAILFYQKAIATGGGQIDYAKYQIGLSYGFQKKYVEKASIMLDIVNNHSKSILAVPALYEAGDAYRLVDKNDDPGQKVKAMKYYNQLIQDHPRHPRVVDAIFQIGMLNFVDQDYVLAEKQFLRILNEYSGSKRETETLKRLEDVYTALNQPDTYVDLLESMGKGLDQNEKDELMYNSAYRAFEDSLFTSAASSFEKYLNAFTKPNHEIDALFYVARSYSRLGQKEKALVAYKKLLTKPTHFYTEEAAALASKDEYDAKNYEKAIAYYDILDNNASYPGNKLKAQIGLMRCYTFQEEFGVAKVYANRVLVDPLSLENVKIEAHYVLGKAELRVDNYTEALKEFKIVSDETSSILGAEAQYSIAFIYHRQEDYAISEEEVRKLMKQRAGYTYWVAKALILQAKNSIGLDNYVQAEYTIDSVLKGYKITDDGIIDEANEVVAVINAHKDQEKEIDPDVDNTIEIGDGNE